MVLSIVQMQFIFLNTKEFEMQRHQVIVRFGLMHMLATNLCEWLYVLVEETKHEIINLTYKEDFIVGKSNGKLIDQRRRQGLRTLPLTLSSEYRITLIFLVQI